MSSHDDIATRWRDRAMGKTDRANYSRGRSNVWGRGDTLYSYETHFPLVELLRDAKGSPRLFLLNGDRYSVTTTRHQRIARDVVARVRDEIPSVVIPFAALDAAGMDRASLELVDDEPERHETIPHSAVIPWRADGIKYVWRDGMTWRNVPADEREARRAAGEAYPPSQEYVPTGRRDVDRETSAPFPTHGVTVDVPEDAAWLMVLAIVGCDVAEYRDAVAPVVARWNTYRHWLGESLIRGRVKVPSRACKCQTDPAMTELDRSNVGADGCGRRGCSWGMVHPRPRVALFLSGFDENERRPLYFLCELPKVDVPPTTVREAYRDLKPETVKLAEAMGKDVKRQGDIYAIPTELTTRQLRSMGATFGRKNHRIRWTDADPVDVYGPRVANRYPTDLERETHPMDYIAGIGHVIHGHQYIPRVATDLDADSETARLLGTNHVGTYVARLPNGTTLARGTMTHDPGFRGPDHSRVTLGDAWHVILKNTVPVVR
jgi:hypothetical protein